MMAVLAGKLKAQRKECAPVAGKSTLNRLELSCLEPTRYQRSVIRIARSVAPSNSAPASEVIAPPSKAATTSRPATGANPNKSGVQSVGIGVLRDSREVVAAQ
jgi:hypothetical protein